MANDYLLDREIAVNCASDNEEDSVGSDSISSIGNGNAVSGDSSV